MSELDLGLKVGSRRLLWNMGLSTRLDVELRGEHTSTSAGTAPRGPETFTDLDVLGVSLTPGYELTWAIADCKTSRKDSTSRMFWVRGVADFFGADSVFLVREHDVTDAARQLASRLRITVLASADLAHMQQLYPDTFDPHGPLALLFDRDQVAHQLSAFTGLDRRLRRLLDYRQFDYWVNEQYRNLQQLVSHLNAAKTVLQSNNSIHVGLFLDLAWLYLLSLIHATAYVRGAFLTDIDRGIREYLFGGAARLHHKQRLAEQLRAVAPDTIPAGELDHLPPYYRGLRELALRLLRRPHQMPSALRHCEAATAFALTKTAAATTSVLGAPDDDPIAVKLAADVCGFLVSAGDLDPGFRAKARGLLLGETPSAAPAPAPATTTTPTAQPAEGEQLNLPERRQAADGRLEGVDLAVGVEPAVGEHVAGDLGTVED